MPTNKTACYSTKLSTVAATDRLTNVSTYFQTFDESIGSTIEQTY